MHKIKKTVLFLLAVTIACSGTARAGDAITKLGRGVENVITSPVEFLTQYAVMGESGNPVVRVVGGTIYGLGMMAVRILGGVYEIVTFPVPLPKGYEPVLDPETPLKALHQINS